MAGRTTDYRGCMRRSDERHGEMAEYDKTSLRLSRIERRLFRDPAVSFPNASIVMAAFILHTWLTHETRNNTQEN